MDTNEAVGDLIVRYRNNERQLERSQASLESITTQVHDLHRMLQSQGGTIDVTKTYFQAGASHNPIPRNLMETLADTLGELRDVMGEKRRLETCLNQQDLGMFVQKDDKA